MPLDPTLPFFVRILPCALRSKGQQSELAIRFCVLVFGVLPKIADELNFVFVHSVRFSIFCPCNWGTLKASGVCSQGEGLHFGRGTRKSSPSLFKIFLGGNGKAEDQKPQGAGIPPKPCPMKRADNGGKQFGREQSWVVGQQKGNG